MGTDNLYIRYDPIFLSDKYTIDYHIKAFNKLCSLLDGYVKNIIVSFIDLYKNVKNNYLDLNIKEITNDDYKNIGINFSKSARDHGMVVQTCFEDNDLLEYSFIKRDCLSRELAFKMTGKTNFKKWRARSENKCNCIEMVDIGMYNFCKHFCKYCYANYDEKKVLLNYDRHDLTSTLISGKLEKDDIIKIRK